MPVDYETIHQAYARLSDQDISETMVWREEVMARVKKNLDRRSLTKLSEGQRCRPFCYYDRISFTPHLEWVKEDIYLNLMEGIFDW